jgi:hypothetical protein
MKYNKCEKCGFESNSDWDFMKESKPLRCLKCFKEEYSQNNSEKKEEWEKWKSKVKEECEEELSQNNSTAKAKK